MDWFTARPVCTNTDGMSVGCQWATGPPAAIQLGCRWDVGGPQALSAPIQLGCRWATGPICTHTAGMSVGHRPCLHPYSWDVGGPQALSAPIQLGCRSATGPVPARCEGSVCRMHALRFPRRHHCLQTCCCPWLSVALRPQKP